MKTDPDLVPALLRTRCGCTRKVYLPKGCSEWQVELHAPLRHSAEGTSAEGTAEYAMTIRVFRRTATYTDDGRRLPVYLEEETP